MASRGILIALLASTAVATGCATLNRNDPRSTAVERRNRPAHAGGPALRVVTFNVHGQTARAIARSLRHAPALRGADVVFLQEVEEHAGETPTRPAEVARDLGMSYAYAPGYGLPGGGSHGVAILSKLPLEDVRVIELPRFRVVVNSARRVAIAATVRAGKRRLRLYAVHLDNRISPAQRTRQLAPVIADADRHRRIPAIIAGDMNTSPFGWVGHLLPIPGGHQARRLERFVRAAGFATPVTASGPTSQWLSMRLDAIYVRGLVVTDFDVARGVRISDHLPLWAQLSPAGGRR